jgi:integrase
MLLGSLFKSAKMALRDLVAGPAITLRISINAPKAITGCKRAG